MTNDKEKKTSLMPNLSDINKPPVFFKKVLKLGNEVLVKKPKEGFEKIFDQFAAATGTDAAFKSMDAEFAKRLELVKNNELNLRLRNVFAAPINMMVPGYIPPEYPKTSDEMEFLKAVLKDTFVFAQLDEKQQKRLLKAFEKVTYKAGTTIFREDDIGDALYLVQLGAVIFEGEKLESSGIEGAMAKHGDIFGEIALLFDFPRHASAIAENDCVLWRLDQITYRKVTAHYRVEEDNETKQILKKVPIFQDLDDEFLTRIAQALSVTTYQPGQEIIRKGQEAKSMFIIKEGHVKGTDISVGDATYDDLTIGAGNSFGEGAIMQNRGIAGTAIAVDTVTMFTLSREVFLKLFGDMEGLIEMSIDAKKLRAIKIAGREKKKLEDHEANALASMIVNQSFKKGHTFYHEAKYETPAIYFVRSGSVSVRSAVVEAMASLAGVFGHKKDGKTGLTTVGEGGYFGADMLNQPGEAKTTLSRFTIAAEEDCTVGILSMRDIWSVLTGDMKKAGTIEFKDLEKHKLLGAGTFGKVWLVSKKGAKTAYALKVQGKENLIKFNQVEGVLREKAIMARLDHPFIIRLVNSYQDDPNIYMLMALYQGGELRSLISSGHRKWMPEVVAKFYAAGILEGLSFMHQRKIIHRDLKPENVLLDAEGYTVLIDLGFAKMCRQGKTYTFCGTPLYLAPEVISNIGHDKGADIWSWGVMLYEMMCGCTPFLDQYVRDQMDLYKRIVSGKFDFPFGSFLSGEAKSLLKHVLVTNPIERFGCLAGGDVDIKRHPFFRDIDFKKLAQKELKAPWVPKVKDPLDASNFEDWSEEEKKDETKPPKPLSASQQAKFQDF